MNAISTNHIKKYYIVTPIDYCQGVLGVMAIITGNGGAHGVMVIVTGHGHGDSSSIHGQDCLHFT